MTTGRINQVAAFLTHPPGRRAANRRGASRENSPHAAEAGEGAGFDGEVSIGHAERPTRRRCQSTRTLGRLPFFESSLRVPSARSSDSETARLGCRNTRPGGTPAGAAVPPAGRCRSRNPTGPRTDTDCSGNGFGDTPAHRVMIQAPQPRLHPGTRHGGSPPSAGLAPNQPALKRTWDI